MKLEYNDIVKGHHKFKYRGISTLKCPFDYALYQMIITDIQPDLLIEIGTNAGGSALYYADLMEVMGKGIVHTIDIEDKTDSNPLISNHPRITRFLEGYQNYDLNLTKNFKTIMVIDDGSHHYKHVLDALNIFGKIVTKDSYYIVEDGCVTWMGVDSNYDGGPLRATTEFVPDSDFIVDTELCDFFGFGATFNPSGYLKKIK